MAKQTLDDPGHRPSDSVLESNRPPTDSPAQSSDRVTDYDSGSADHAIGTEDADSFRDETSKAREPIPNPDQVNAATHDAKPPVGGSGAVEITGPTQTETSSVSVDADYEVLVASVRDQPSEIDSLGFAPYVEAIASFLTADVTKPPLTLSIEGEWGSGKSSFMLQLKKKLRGKVSVVDFNAWRYDKDDAMWAAFALEFARKLSRELALPSRWWAHVKLSLRRFKWERGWMDVVRLLLMLAVPLVVVLFPILMWDRIIAFVTSGDTFSNTLGKTLKDIVVAGGALGYIGLLAFLFFKLRSIIGNPFKINLKQYLETPDYESRVAFIERFHEDFGKVADIYGKNRKICVFIDDLDRCEVPKAADLMQALNLMISDSSKLIFIMGMDREKVAAGLAVKYEKLLPYLAPAMTVNGSPSSAGFDPMRGLEYGYGFIEKFIQLPFRIPQASDSKVDEFLTELLGGSVVSVQSQPDAPDRQGAAAGEAAERLVTKDSEKVKEILKMVAPTFEYNPRRLKQFINAFRLKTFIASRTGLFGAPKEGSKFDQLTIEQLGKFVAISLCWPLLLADLDNERDLLSRLQILVLGKLDPEALRTRDDRAQEVLKPKVTVDPGSKVVKITDALARWYRRDNLRKFLGVSLLIEDGEVAKETEKIYSLEKLDVNRLLEVSPLNVVKPAPSTSAAKAIDVAKSAQGAAA